MASFSTHINVAGFVSGVGAVSLSLSPKESILYFFAGMIGGILPDIDHDNSKITKTIQYFFSNLIAFFLTYPYIGKYPILNVVLIWFISYLIGNFIFYNIKQFTKHRGIIHSIPFAFISWFFTTSFLYYYFNVSLKISYLTGFFIFLGYISHLILDEIFSVDLLGNRIKKSFGSALKFVSQNKAVTILTYLFLFIIFAIMPQKEYILILFKRLN